MRIALISDVHANVPALEAVFDDIHRRGADQVVCLGDIVDLGPEPGRVIQILKERGVPCLVGNHDPFSGDPIPPVEVYHWSRAQLTEAELLWLRSLPPNLSFEDHGRRLLCVHGSPRSFDEQILAETTDADLRQMMGPIDCDVLAAGHTHVQLDRSLDGCRIINPGSVGMPFREPLLGAGPPIIEPWAEYGVVTLGPDVHFEPYRVAYDTDEYFRRIRSSSMPDPEGWLQAWATR